MNPQPFKQRLLLLFLNSFLTNLQKFPTLPFYQKDTGGMCVRSLLILAHLTVMVLWAQNTPTGSPAGRSFALMHETMPRIELNLLKTETRQQIADSWTDHVYERETPGIPENLAPSFRFPIPGITLSSLRLISKGVGINKVRGFIIVIRLPNLKKSKFSLTQK